MKNKIKFVFFGTGNFAVGVLDELAKNDLVPDLIVSTLDKPKGRKMELAPSPVKEWAQKNNKVILLPEKLHEIHDMIATYFDIFVVAEYGKIIPIQIFNIPKYGTINVHPSLLPKFRGPSPIQSFILSGQEKTGVTIMLMDQHVDHGPIIAQKNLDTRCPSGHPVSKCTYKDLEKKLARLGGKMLAEAMPMWIEGKIKSQEQNHSKATFTEKIKKEDGLVKETDSPENIERKVRAFTPWPGAYFFAGGKRIIITEAEIQEGRLVIKKIKPEGKKEMPLEDFLRGNKETESQIKKLAKNI